MNIEAYDAESLRKLVRTLQSENKLLKDTLKKANIPFSNENPFEETIDNIEEYNPDQGERIINPNFITGDMPKCYFSMFWGREDVYAKRGKNVVKKLFVMNVKTKNRHTWIQKSCVWLIPRDRKSQWICGGKITRRGKNDRNLLY